MKNISGEILLTIEERGRLGDPVSHVSNDKIVERVKASPFERFSDDGKVITPKNIFRAPNDYKARKYRTCQRKTKLSAESVEYFTSKTVPEKLGRKRELWLSMSPKQRLEWHLNEVAEGKPFTYEMVSD